MDRLNLLPNLYKRETTGFGQGSHLTHVFAGVFFFFLFSDIWGINNTGWIESMAEFGFDNLDRDQSHNHSAIEYCESGR